MWTVLPLGLAHQEGSLPNGTLGISGALHTRAWIPLQAVRRVCTFERHDLYEVPDGLLTQRDHVRNPLPRCRRRACYRSIQLCEPVDPADHRAATNV